MFFTYFKTDFFKRKPGRLFKRRLLLAGVMAEMGLDWMDESSLFNKGKQMTVKNWRTCGPLINNTIKK